MKRNITLVMTTLMLIGILAVSLNVIFGYNTITFVERYRDTTTGLWYYKYNFWQYINNITTNVSDTSPLILQMPTREWQIVQGVNWWEPLGNDLALIFDYLIVVVNIIIYPIRLGGYIVRLVLVIIGLNFNNSPNNSIKWLVDLINGMIPLQIPYV